MVAAGNETTEKAAADGDGPEVEAATGGSDEGTAADEVAAAVDGTRGSAAGETRGSAAGDGTKGSAAGDVDQRFCSRR